MFIASAFAADTVSATIPAMSPVASGALPMLMIVLVFYIFVIRPSQKKIKDHEGMIKALRRGDKVVTAGGVIGVISKLEDDNVIVLEIADNVKIRVVRDTISTVMTKMPIANDNKAETRATEKNNSNK